MRHRFQSAGAPWLPGWRNYGGDSSGALWERQDLCVESGSQGLAQPWRVRPAGRSGASPWVRHPNAEFHMVLVLSGGLAVCVRGAATSRYELRAGDTVVLPPTLEHQFQALGPELRLLECYLPASPEPCARL